MSTTKTSAQVPKLRFPGFKGEWKDVAMGELLSFKNGYNAEKEQYGTGVKFINVLDIIQNDYITHDRIIGSVTMPEKDFEKNEVRYGDLLFQRSSETREEVGQANVYLDKDTPATFGGFVIRGRPLKEFDSVYFNALLKTAKVRKDMTSRSGGATRYNIGQDSLEEVTVNLSPFLPEQQKIAAFLTAVDGRIEQLSRKKALLEATKKGVMQQLFTQTLRFQDDHGHDFPNWEEKTLGDVAKVIDCKHRTPEYVESGIPIVSPGSIRWGEIDLISPTKRVTECEYRSLMDHCEPHVGDLVLSRNQSLGVASYITSNKKFVLGQDTVLIQPNEMDGKIIFYRLQTSETQNVISQLSGGSTFSRINLKDIRLLPLALPSERAEQTKIAGFLSALDGKIGAVGEQMRQTQAWKKGLLQQMFV